MANIASQKKRILRAERERLENRRYTSRIKTEFRRLEAAGWVLQHRDELNRRAARGVAVREYPLPAGEADYLLQIVTVDMMALDRMLRVELSRLPGVRRTITSMAMRQGRNTGTSARPAIARSGCPVSARPSRK